jgi:hypothetical protein
MADSRFVAFCCIIFLGLFAFIGIEKYGIVVAFIKISGIFYFLSSFAATYWISRFIHSYFESRYHLEPWRTVSGPYEWSRIIVTFFIFFALMWAIERSGDNVLIAATNLSKNVLWPCQADFALTEEETMEARNLWRLKEHQQFECEPRARSDEYM